MSEDEKGMTSAGRFTRLLAIGSFLLVALATLTGAMGNIEKVSAYLFPKSPPSLEIKFASDASAETVLRIVPTWEDFGYGGFSKSIKLPLVVRNSGEVTAENIKINLVFGPSLSISNNSGEEADPVHVSELLDVTGYEEVRTVAVARLANSKSYEWLDQNLELRFRLRERVGVPMLKKNVPLIQPLWIDFTSSKLGEIGRFPIEYTVSSDGIDDSTGILVVEIDTSVLASVQSFDATKAVAFDLSENKAPPTLDTVEMSASRSVSFFAGNIDELSSSIIAGDDTPLSKLVQYELKEFIADDDQWLDFTDEFGLRYIFVDRAKNLTLDEFYADLDGSGGHDWHQMKPNSPTPYIPLNRILDFADDGGVFSQTGNLLFGGD